MRQTEEILILRQENAALRKENAALHREVSALKKEISELKEIVVQLQGQVKKDSKNSSKPPSTDIRRTKSLRKKSKRSPGGQTGHKGSTLKMSATVDKVVEHDVDRCACCGKDLSIFHTHRYEHRQLYDIPPPRMRVTEHHAAIKQCIYCGTENKAAFPESVSKKVQYGPNIKQLGVYLSQYQLLPYGRSAELIEEITGHRISTGSLVKFISQCSEKLGGFMEKLKTHCQQSPVLHDDETGFRFEGKRKWLHVAATPDSTYYMAHARRGKEAMEDMDVLPDYKGVTVHDYWKSYFTFEGCEHALCNAHHLRDLTFCHAHEKSKWAKQMIDLLLLIKAKVDTAKEGNLTELPPKELSLLTAKYDKLINAGYKEHPIPEKPPDKRGKVKKTKTQNLLIRFDKHKEDILRFLDNFDVPFDNNPAERAIRMMRVKQKISGCFRSKQGAQTFAKIRSYIDTSRKNDIPVMTALGQLVEGKPCSIPFA